MSTSPDCEPGAPSDLPLPLPPSMSEGTDDDAMLTTRPSREHGQLVDDRATEPRVVPVIAGEQVGPFARAVRQMLASLRDTEENNGKHQHVTRVGQLRLQGPTLWAPQVSAMPANSRMKPKM
jgi:hypothetical protein